MLRRIEYDPSVSTGHNTQTSFPVRGGVPGSAGLLSLPLPREASSESLEYRARSRLRWQFSGHGAWIRLAVLRRDRAYRVGRSGLYRTCGIAVQAFWSLLGGGGVVGSFDECSICVGYGLRNPESGQTFGRGCRHDRGVDLGFLTLCGDHIDQAMGDQPLGVAGHGRRADVLVVERANRQRASVGSVGAVLGLDCAGESERSDVFSLPFSKRGLANARAGDIACDDCFRLLRSDIAMDYPRLCDASCNFPCAQQLWGGTLAGKS